MGSRWAAAISAPYIPGKRYIDWNLPDPGGRPIAEVRAIRDEIDRRVHALVDELDHTRAAEPAGAQGGR
jgi:hypothetical protein